MFYVEHDSIRGEIIKKRKELKTRNCLLCMLRLQQKVERSVAQMLFQRIEGTLYYEINKEKENCFNSKVIIILS